MGVNAHYGTPLNPTAPERVPGGSTSSLASAVADGGVDFALGTDTGGSVRLLACCCGIIDIRTSHGRIPTAGIVPLVPSFETVGWFAREPHIMIRVGSTLGIGEAQPSSMGSNLLIPRDLWNLPPLTHRPRRSQICEGSAISCGRYVTTQLEQTA